MGYCPFEHKAGRTIGGTQGCWARGVGALGARGSWACGARQAGAQGARGGAAEAQASTARCGTARHDTARQAWHGAQGRVCAATRPARPATRHRVRTAWAQCARGLCALAGPSWVLYALD